MYNYPYYNNNNACGKDPCPLKSFCDPGLAYSCANRPILCGQNNCGPQLNCQSGQCGAPMNYDPRMPMPIAPGMNTAVIPVGAIPGGRRTITTWKINYLVSNRNNYAAHNDPDLINPWGIVVYNSQLWVANGSTDSISNYDLFGNKLLGTISIRDAAHNSSYPTGLAINCSGGFTVSNGSTEKSAQLMTATEHGTVHAFNPNVDPLNAYIVLNQQLTGLVSVYKGLAIANGILYLADFFQSQIDVFDSDYNRISGFAFIDGDMSDPIPLDYGPNNIVHIGGFLYVLWARKSTTILVHDLDGVGHGFISVFTLNGAFVRRFTSRGVLNSPWAMIPAPMECGIPPGAFLVGNNGDGRINIFDCNGNFVGPLVGMSGLPVHIEGLWGLAPYYVDFSEIFFASAPDENVDGLVGSLVKDQTISY